MQAIAKPIKPLLALAIPSPRINLLLLKHAAHDCVASQEREQSHPDCKLS
ncbi:MAG: hypothetical protein P8P56_12280 [Yoonia sp.]|nr:hypothetical protein [Yoonia sp.]